VRAAVFHGPRALRVEEVPEPQAGPRDIVVSVRACGVCGTDLHAYADGTLVAPGQVLGHEFAGEVVAVGRMVDGIRAGDRITASPLQPCRRCARCAEGRFNLCDTAWSTAIGLGEPGAFAERVRIPDARLGENVFQLADELSFAAAATTEPLAVAVHGVRLAPQVSAATTAVVLGLGPIGLQCVQVLHAYGAGRVVGVDLSALRRAAAEAIGAEATADLAGLEAVDVVFECTGVAALALQALRTVRAGGTAVLLAVYADRFTLNPNLVVSRELAVRGAIAYTAGDFAEAVRLLATGAARGDALISHRTPLADITRAFELQQEKDRSLKVLVEPHAG
jgi:threonine dehydrogenase-like Zn-dependent dehydrogenase